MNNQPRFTYRHGAWLLGAVVLASFAASEVGGLSHTTTGFVAWLVGLVVLAVVCPVWGFCLGRCYTGRGSLPFGVRRPR